MVYHTTTPFEPHAVHSERLMRPQADALLPPCRAYNPRRRRWEPLLPNGDAPPATTDAPGE